MLFATIQVNVAELPHVRQVTRNNL